MKSIPRNSKISAILHNDFDASTSSIILSHIYTNIKFFYTSFYKIDEILENFNFSYSDHVFLIDIHPDKEKNLYLSDKIILLDHHETAKNLNNPKLRHFVVTNMCAAKLVYKFMDKMYPEVNISHLKELVEITNDYDLYTLKNPKSKLMNDLMFYKYGPARFRKAFMNGRTEFNQEELDWLAERDKEFWNIWNNLNVYDIEEGLPMCIVEANSFMNEIADKLMKEEGYDVVFIRNPQNERASIRTKREDINTGKILKDLGYGGGHAKASGMFAQNKSDFKEKTLKVINIIKENIYG